MPSTHSNLLMHVIFRRNPRGRSILEAAWGAGLGNARRIKMARNARGRRIVMAQQS
jgi:hypothetical protein